MSKYTNKAAAFMLARLSEISPVVMIFLMNVLRQLKSQKAEDSGKPVMRIGLDLVRRAWLLVSWFRQFCDIDAAASLQDVQLRIAAEMLQPTNQAKVRGRQNHCAFLTVVASALVVLYRYQMPQAA